MLRARPTRCDVTSGTPLPWLAALLVAYRLVPIGPAVVRLLGIRNLRAGRMRDAGTLESAGTAIATGAVGLPAGTVVEWCIRPEHVELDSEPAGAGEHGATIVDLIHMGPKSVSWRAAAELLVVLDGGCELTVVGADDGVATTCARCRVQTPSGTDRRVADAGRPG